MTAVILCGEAGVGKTRLVEELVQCAEDIGVTVLGGGGLYIADSPPFWPIVAGLDAWSRTPAAQRVPEVAARLEALLTDVDPDASTDRRGGTRTLELLGGIIRDLAAHSTVLIVLEDLHWADRSTCDLIVYLVANLTAHPVMVLMTQRTDPATRMTHSRRFVAELQRHRQVRCADLAPLSRDAITAFVAAAAPTRSPGLVDRVWQRSSGNMFIAEQTLLAAMHGDPDSLPSTLRDLVLTQFTPLSDAAARVTRAVAVCDGLLPHRLLCDVLHDTGEAALLAAVREAVEAGVVVVDELGDGYRLRHGLMTEVVVAELLPGERIDLHRRYAVALQTPPQAPGTDARLVHHWQLAGDIDRALAAGIAAARAADRAHGHAESHRHWLRAARLADDGLTEPPPVSRAECLQRAAESAHLAGDHDQAVALLGELRSVDGDTTDADPVELHTRTGRYLMAAGRSGEAVHALRRATEFAGHGREATDPVRIEALCGLAGALRQDGEFTASREVAREALAAARAADLPQAQAQALADLGFSLAYLEDPEAGSAALREALAVAERAGEPDGIARAHLRLAELLSGPLNDLTRGIEVARAGAERVSGLGLATTAGVALLAVAAGGLFRMGRWDEADGVIAEAWDLHPTGAAALEVRLARARTDIGRGRFAAAEDDLEAVEVLCAGSAGPRYRLPLLTLRAGLAIWQGRPDLALDDVGTGLDVVDEGSDDVWLVGPLVWHGTRACAELTRLGLPPAGPSIAGRLRWHAEDLARRAAAAPPAIRVVVDGFVLMCDAEQGRAGGRLDPDIWARIATLWEERQQPYPCAYAHLRRAEALLSVHARSAAGAEALRHAERTARTMGAEPFLAEVVELADRARITLSGVPGVPRPGVADTAPAPALGELAALTPRELDVLAELATGRTNREIGKRLFISEKTVGIHVGRVYAKLDVHSRVQASAVWTRARSSGQAQSSRESRSFRDSPG